PPAGLVLDGCEHAGRLVCAGNDVDCLVPAFVLDRREIADRRVATSRVVEAFDKAEHGTARLGRCPEPASREQFAFQRGEEALAHRIVIGIAHRTHRGTHAGIATTLAELDRGILRSLIRVMDHALRPPCLKRHVQRVEYQLTGQCRRHRPADDAAPSSAIPRDIQAIRLLSGTINIDSTLAATLPVEVRRSTYPCVMSEPRVLCRTK